MPDLVTEDQLREIEVVAGVAADPVGEATSERDLDVSVEQRDLHSVHAIGVGRDERDDLVRGAREIRMPPVALERGIEHLTEPVDDDRPSGGSDDLVVHGAIVIRTSRGARQVAAAHEHGTTTDSLDVCELLEVGLRDGAERLRLIGELIGGDTADDGIAVGGCCSGRPLHELTDDRVRDAHPALSGVHRLGDPEPQRPEVLSEPKGRLPVHLDTAARVDVDTRVDDHVRGGEDTATDGGFTSRRSDDALLPERDRPEGPASEGNGDRPCGTGHVMTSSRSTHRRSAQERIVASTSCVPRTPASSPYGNGSSTTTCRRNRSH